MWLFIVVLGGAALWTLLPDWRYHKSHDGVITVAKGTENMVALTFDDGPDPEYTPVILDALAKQDAKATFFLVGKKAAAHPDLVRRILAEGHEIGNHTLHHRHAWLTIPGLVKGEINGSAEVLQGITGEPVHYFRPPWGMFNLFTYRVARKSQAVVLWNVEVRDWAGESTPESITKEVLAAAKPGAIIDLHDSGGAPGAPARTAAALPAVIIGLRDKGLEPVTLTKVLQGEQWPQAMPFWQKVLRPLWDHWEKAFSQRHGIRNIGQGERTMLRLEILPYKGAPLVLKDGTEITPGDTVGEIHIGNERLLQMQNEGIDFDTVAPFQTLKELRAGFREMARMAEQGEIPPEVKGFGGISLLHRGAFVLGFEVREVTSRFTRWRIGIYEKWLLVLYHPHGFRRLLRGSQGLDPKEIWLSRKALMEKYGRPVKKST